MFTCMCYQNARASVVHSPVTPSVRFIENKGQWPDDVRFRATVPGGMLFVTNQALVFMLVDEKALHERGHNKKDVQVKAHSYKVQFIASNPKPSIQYGSASTERYNYYKGSDPEKWKTGCRAFDRVTLKDIYPGIDLELIALEDGYKTNFLVHPGASPLNIKVQYEGVERPKIIDESLHFSTIVADIKEERPVAFQQGNNIDCRYHIQDGKVGFTLGKYNTNQLLVIDPEVVFATYSGSVADNFGFTGTYDPRNKDGYAGGTVFDFNFPVTVGAIQNIFNGPNDGYDMGILKFSNDGKQLLYATYLGGSLNDRPHSMICNNEGDLFILGTSESPDFPVKSGSFDITFNGRNDIVVLRISPDGAVLKGSTFFGGSDHDGINGTDHTFRNYDSTTNTLAFNESDFFRGEIILDAFGNPLIASCTQSDQTERFPTRLPFQTLFGGGFQDGCVVKFNANLSTLAFSSYLGGTGEDAAYAITIDKSNAIFVTGGTTSRNIGRGVTTGFNYHGDEEGFVAKLNSNGSLLKLIYVGTNAYDQSYFIDTDVNGNVYIAGQTLGAYPVVGTVYRNNGGNQFVSILDNNLTALLYSTVFGSGGGLNITLSAFSVDLCGKIYVSGWGGSINQSYQPTASTTFGLPIVANAYQPATDGADFYIIVFDRNLSKLKYATYLGGVSSGDHVDGGTSRFDEAGDIFQSICGGCGGFSDLPTTPGAWSTVNKGRRPQNPNWGGCNNALIRFNADPSDRAPVVRDTLLYVTQGAVLTYKITVTEPDDDSLSLSFSGEVLNRANNKATLTEESNTGSSIVTRLEWQTDCDASINDTVSIQVTARDNGCFVPLQTIATIKIVVLSNTIPPPFLQCIQPINQNTVKLTWNPVQGYDGLKSYRIFKKAENGAFEKLAEVPSSGPTSFTDSDAPNNLTSNFCYFIQSVNICDTAYDSSRVVCSLANFSTDSFYFDPDTVYEVIATEAFIHTQTFRAANPLDSVYIMGTSGTLAQTGRVSGRITTDSIGLARYTFSWRSICGDAIGDTLELIVKIRNNTCPVPTISFDTIRLKVVPLPLLDPPLLQCAKVEEDGRVVVRWRVPTTLSPYFKQHVVVRRNPDYSFLQVANLTDPNTNLITDNVVLNPRTNPYCYQVYAVNICDYAGDSSEPVCTYSQDMEYPSPLSIHTTTVVDNSKVLTSWEKSKDPLFYKYRVLKKPNQEGSSFSFCHESTNINDTVFIDAAVKVGEKSYCYEIAQENECGVRTKNSKFACSILLQGKSKPFEHRVYWSDYVFFDNGLQGYELLRGQPGYLNSDESIVFQSSWKQRTVYDAKLNTDHGLYTYTVSASERESDYSSRSNTIELIQAPLLHTPNAFTPNENGVNDTWMPVPVFVKEYHLWIYDRWGRVVYETQNKHQPWNGEIAPGIKAPDDVFVYIVNYTGWEGTNQTVKGNFTLLR